MIKNFNLLDKDSMLTTWCVIPSPDTIEIIAQSGFDSVIIDQEHGPMNHETAINMVRAAELHNCTPLIRVASHSEENILTALETGAHGIVVPGVSNAIQAETVVQYTKYAPIGIRGSSPYTRSAGYGYRYEPQFNNDNNIICLIVEGKLGVQNLWSISSTEHIDIIYIGTYDLAQALGHPGQPRHADVLGWLETSAKTLKENEVIMGCLAESAEEISELKNLGVEFIAYKSDCAILADAAIEVVGM